MADPAGPQGRGGRSVSGVPYGPTPHCARVFSNVFRSVSAGFCLDKQEGLEVLKCLVLRGAGGLWVVKQPGEVQAYRAFGCDAGHVLKIGGFFLVVGGVYAGGGFLEAGVFSG